jgi:hypothetical protein
MPGPDLVEGAEQPQRFLDRLLVGEPRLLELDPEPCAQCRGSSWPQRMPSTSTTPGVRRGQAFEDLDRRRLAGAVRAEQAEALAALRSPGPRARPRRWRRTSCAARDTGSPAHRVAGCPACAEDYAVAGGLARKRAWHGACSALRASTGSTRAAYACASARAGLSSGIPSYPTEPFMLEAVRDAMAAHAQGT